MRKALNEKLGFAFIKPSVERWLMDQPEENDPKSIEEVRRYLKAEDPGTFKLSTNKGDHIVQDLVNSFLRAKVSWLEQDLTVVISKQGKLGLLNKRFQGFHIIVCYVQYDFNKSFSANLGIVSKKCVELLNLHETSQKSFDETCSNAVIEAKESGRKPIYLYDAETSDDVVIESTKVRNAHKLFEDIYLPNILVPKSWAELIYNYKTDGTGSEYLSDEILDFIHKNQLEPGDYGKLRYICGNTDEVYDNADFQNIVKYIDDYQEYKAGFMARGIGTSYYGVYAYSNALVIRNGSNPKKRGEFNGPVFWTIVALQDELYKLMADSVSVTESVRIHKRNRTNETKSIDELEGEIVSGTWKGDKLIVDGTGEEYNVGTKAPVKYHTVFRISHGTLIPL